MFLEILSTITVPLIALILLGYFGQRSFNLDPRTLGQVLINIVAPGAFVYFLVSSPASLSDAGFVTGFVIARFFVLYLLGWSVAYLLGFNPVLRRIAALAIAFPNSGNYGIPLVQLAFGDTWLFHQSVVTSAHAILIVAIMPVLFTSGRFSIVGVVKSAFSTPLLPAVLVGLIIKSAEIPIPEMVMTPLRLLGGTLTPLALLTLGVQLASTSRVPEVGQLSVIIGFRLFAAPLLSFIALWAIGESGEVRDYLVVNACAPVGVILAVLLADRREYTSLVSGAVAYSTVLAPLVVAPVLWLIRG